MLNTNKKIVTLPDTKNPKPLGGKRGTHTPPAGVPLTLGAELQ